MYNKRKRESNEDVIYSRFVLSSVRVKEKLLSDEDLKKKRRKKPAKSTKSDQPITEEGEEAYHIEEEEKEFEKKQLEKEKREDTKPKPKIAEIQRKNKVG